MKVPFVDLARSYDKKTMMQAIERIVDKGSFVYGEEIHLLEKQIEDYLDVENAVGVSSGTQALELALKAAGIAKYDKVLVPANSFVATAFAVSNTGGIPIFCDVDPDTWCMSLDIVKKAYEEYGNFFAVIPVHMFGLAIPDIGEIVDFCRMKGAVVVEDCAQALGAEARYGKRQKKIGSFGDVNCLSFYPTKTLGAFGNAGMVVGNKTAYCGEALLLKSYGFDEKRKYSSKIVGTNANMDTIQAAILCEALKSFGANNLKRIQAAHTYRKMIEEDVLLSRHLKLQWVSPEDCTITQNTTSITGHVYHLFVVTTDSISTRFKLMEYLKSKDIGCAIHYQVPIHMQVAYATHEEFRLPNVERLADTMISLPMFAGITTDEIRYVCETIKEFYEKNPSV